MLYVDRQSLSMLARKSLPPIIPQGANLRKSQVTQNFQKEVVIMESFKLPHELRMTELVYRNAFLTIGSLPAPRGGILGSSDGGRTIDHFHFDECADANGTEYSPDMEALGQYVIPDWNAQGIEMVGFIQSLPHGVLSPSRTDELYSAALIGNNLNRLALPIVKSAADGLFRMHGYYAVPHDGQVRIVDVPICIVPDFFNIPALPPASTASRDEMR
jgi:hypothetical protein